MKKTKRTSMLVAGATALSAALLIPTVLSACSTSTSESQNQDNQVNEDIIELNKDENAATRKSIYNNFIDLLNNYDPTLKEITKPEFKPFKVTIPFSSMIKSRSFINELISMLEFNLDAPSSKVNERQWKNLISEMKSNIESMLSSNADAGSSWGADAFKFDDTDIPTWSFNSKDKDIQYELYLTSDMEIKYEFNAKTVSVKIINKNATANKSRLSVKSPTISPSNFVDLYFRSNLEFKLPESLFDDFNNYFDVYSANANNPEIKKYLQSGFEAYDSTIKKSYINSTTIWNQFVLANESSLKTNLESDLNTNRVNSQLFKWIKQNFKSTNTFTNTTMNVKNTSIISDLEKDINSATSIHLQMSPLYIAGQNLANNENKIFISFADGTANNSNLANKLYILDLQATDFKFAYNLTLDNFGFNDAALSSSLKLSFGSNSSLSLLLTDANSDLEGKQKQTELKSLNDVDVSDIFDKDYSSFSNFMLSLLKDENTNSQITNQLLQQQNTTNGKKTLLDKFKAYLSSDATQIINNLKKPNVLADFIFDNIDLNNMAMYTHNQISSGTNTMPVEQNQWKEKLNSWLTSSKAPTITIGSEATDTYKKSANNVATLLNNAYIKIQSTDNNNNNNNLDLGTNGSNNDQLFSGIYIFLDKDGTDLQNLIMNAGFDKTSASSNVIVNQNEKSINENKNTDLTQFLNAVESSFSVVFQKSNKSDPAKASPLYGFYMGQKLSGEQQVELPISLNKLIANSANLINYLKAK